jgi:hypothetical protein
MQTHIVRWDSKEHGILYFAGFDPLPVGTGPFADCWVHDRSRAVALRAEAAVKLQPFLAARPSELTMELADNRANPHQG